MSREISEADWKIFRGLHRVALERFCERVLAEVAQLTTVSTSQSAHERYLAVFKCVWNRNQELADAFDDFRRSTARRQLAIIRSHQLLTDEEFAKFSLETREAVAFFIDFETTRRAAKK